MTTFSIFIIGRISRPVKAAVLAVLKYATNMMKMPAATSIILDSVSAMFGRYKYTLLVRESKARCLRHRQEIALVPVGQQSILTWITDDQFGHTRMEQNPSRCNQGSGLDSKNMSTKA
jgi:hypothetical protein